MMRDVADFYDREVEYDIANLSAIIEPLLTIVIGAMVLVLALGVFLPMWDLTQYCSVKVLIARFRVCNMLILLINKF